VIWEKVFEQPHSVEILKAHIAEKRLASTYLITGTPAAGKKEMAIAFAAALNCLKVQSFADCDCVSCRKIYAGNHPDLRCAGDHDEKSVKIEEVRNLLPWVYLKPFEAKWKVFVVEGADRLTMEAQNALLKTLEEPPGNTIFCLLAASGAHLLPTIQSRSFELRLRAVDADMEPTLEQLIGRISGLGKAPWEEVFESFQNLKRPAVNDLLLSLMYYFRHLAERQRHEPGYAQAVAAVYETREALEANANQKLALTRLAMRLRQFVAVP
jgi:hypothetical protein